MEKGGGGTGSQAGYDVELPIDEEKEPREGKYPEPCRGKIAGS